MRVFLLPPQQGKVQSLKMTTKWSEALTQKLPTRGEMVRKRLVLQTRVLLLSKEWNKMMSKWKKIVRRESKIWEMIRRHRVKLPRK